MKHLTLQIADVYPLADGQTVQCGPWTLTREHFESALKKVAAASRNVRITPPGYLVRSHPKALKQADQWPARDWRFYYEKLLCRIFPSPAWIYTGAQKQADELQRQTLTRCSDIRLRCLADLQKAIKDLE